MNKELRIFLEEDPTQNEFVRIEKGCVETVINVDDEYYIIYINDYKLCIKEIEECFENNWTYGFNPLLSYDCSNDKIISTVRSNLPSLQHYHSLRLIDLDARDKAGEADIGRTYHYEKYDMTENIVKYQGQMYLVRVESYHDGADADKDDVCSENDGFEPVVNLLRNANLLTPSSCVSIIKLYELYHS